MYHFLVKLEQDVLVSFLVKECIIFSKRRTSVIKSNQNIFHVKKQNALFLSAL